MLHAVQKWYCKEGPEMSEAIIKYINAPLSEATIKDLHAGDVVRISGSSILPVMRHISV